MGCHLYPYIKGEMYRWQDRQTCYQKHTVSINDLVGSEKDIRLELLVADKNVRAPEKISNYLNRAGANPRNDKFSPPFQTVCLCHP